MSGTAEQTGADAARLPKGVIPPTTAGGRPSFLSDVIVELGFADRATVEQAVRAARSPGTTVARVLVELGAITEEQLARAAAERYGIDYIDLANFDVDPAATNLIKPTAAKRYQAVPVAFLGSGVLVAMGDPADALGVGDIAVMTKLEVRPAVASRPALRALIEALRFEEPATGVEASATAEAKEEPRSREDSRLDHELETLKRQLAGAEAKLVGGAHPGEQADPSELHARLAEAEAELEEARVRVREAKEVSAELEAMREQLAAAEAVRGGASARVRGADAGAAEVEELRGERDAARQHAQDAYSELRRARTEAEVRSSELESLRTRLTGVETELVRVRGEADAQAAELDAMRARIGSAELEAQEAMHRAARFEREAEAARLRAADSERAGAEARLLAEERDGAEVRVEQTRHALSELRGESELEREQWAIDERDLRQQVAEEERRRREVEERLSEVEAAAFGAERAFEELRQAQSRMREALRALA